MKERQKNIYIYKCGYVYVSAPIGMAENNQDGNCLFLYKFSLFCFS